MKLGKTSWILLIGGILLIVFVSLGFAGTRQMRQQEKLATDLKVAQQRVANLQLEQLTERQEQLNVKLTEVSADLETAKNKMRQPNESIDVTDSIFQIAESCKVTIEEISSAGLSGKEVAKINCSSQALNLIAYGEVLDLVSFIARLNTDFTTGLVGSVNMDIPEPGEERLPAVRIQLNVYNYQGD
ncbi:MAG: hypothetical protein PHR43_03290 [Dehalococcoidales bacterium]|nr:hypothetical protein [Dehalococcoidales bacterium]